MKTCEAWITESKSWCKHSHKPIVVEQTRNASSEWGFQKEASSQWHDLQNTRFIYLMNSVVLPGRGLNEHIIIHLEEIAPTPSPMKFNTTITPGLFSRNTAQLLSKSLVHHDCLGQLSVIIGYLPFWCFVFCFVLFLSVRIRTQTLTVLCNNLLRSYREAP